jgi:hypothetical protein
MPTVLNCNLKHVISLSTSTLMNNYVAIGDIINEELDELINHKKIKVTNDVTIVYLVIDSTELNNDLFRKTSYLIHKTFLNNEDNIFKNDIIYAVRVNLQSMNGDGALTIGYMLVEGTNYSAEKLYPKLVNGFNKVNIATIYNYEQSVIHVRVVSMKSKIPLVTETRPPLVIGILLLWSKYL